MNVGVSDTKDIKRSWVRVGIEWQGRGKLTSKVRKKKESIESSSIRKGSKFNTFYMCDNG